MADHIIHELTESIRQRPFRAAAAFVLLITSTVYLYSGYGSYRVAEIGESASSDQTFGLSASEEFGDDIEQVLADEEDALAVSSRVGERDQYVDARFTHAVASEDEAAVAGRDTVTPVSYQAVRSASSASSPVWLLGVLVDD